LLAQALIAVVQQRQQLAVAAGFCFRRHARRGVVPIAGPGTCRSGFVPFAALLAFRSAWVFLLSFVVVLVGMGIQPRGELGPTPQHDHIQQR
jgi:hypothetical protein